MKKQAGKNDLNEAIFCRKAQDHHSLTLSPLQSVIKNLVINTYSHAKIGKILTAILEKAEKLKKQT